MPRIRWPRRDPPGPDIDGFTVFVWVYWTAACVCAWLAPPEGRVPVLALAIVILPFAPLILFFTPLILIFLALERLF